MMAALVIFSSLIGLASRYVAGAIDRPFVVQRLEPWMTFMEDTARAVRELPAASVWTSPGRHEDPFSAIPVPVDLSSWHLQWCHTNLPDTRAARFTATDHQGRRFEWIVYRTVPH